MFLKQNHWKRVLNQCTPFWLVKTKISLYNLIPGVLLYRRSLVLGEATLALGVASSSIIVILEKGVLGVPGTSMVEFTYSSGSSGVSAIDLVERVESWLVLAALDLTTPETLA